MPGSCFFATHSTQCMQSAQRLGRAGCIPPLSAAEWVRRLNKIRTPRFVPFPCTARSRQCKSECARNLSDCDLIHFANTLQPSWPSSQLEYFLFTRSSETNYMVLIEISQFICWTWEMNHARHLSLPIDGGAFERGFFITIDCALKTNKAARKWYAPKKISSLQSLVGYSIKVSKDTACYPQVATMIEENSRGLFDGKLSCETHVSLYSGSFARFVQS